MSALCPNGNAHTVCPEGYLQWHAWAKQMAKSHTQVKCDGCGLFAIWLPKTPHQHGAGNGEKHGG